MFHENIVAQSCSVQYSWLQATLYGIPQDDWLIVVGHHPIDEVDVKDFTTLLQQRGFSIYLNGHTHTLNQYTIDGAGAYVTTGAGAMGEAFVPCIQLPILCVSNCIYFVFLLLFLSFHVQ